MAENKFIPTIKAHELAALCDQPTEDMVNTIIQWFDRKAKANHWDDKTFQAEVQAHTGMSDLFLLNGLSDISQEVVQKMVMDETIAPKKPHTAIALEEQRCEWLCEAGLACSVGKP